MSTQEQLEKEVEEYNRVVELIQTAEQERLTRLGRVQLLQELAQNELDSNNSETKEPEDEK